ncbi:unnamed protein product [Closterium sp. NIES-53]
MLTKTTFVPIKWWERPLSSSTGIGFACTAAPTAWKSSPASGARETVGSTTPTIEHDSSPSPRLCRWSCRRPSSTTSSSTSASPCAALHLDVGDGWSIDRGLTWCRPCRCHHGRDTRRKGGRVRGRSSTPAVDHHLLGLCPASTSSRRCPLSTAHLRYHLCPASCAALAADSASSVQRSLLEEGAPWAVWPPASPQQVNPLGSILCMGPPNTSAAATLSIARLGRALPACLPRAHGARPFFFPPRARGARRFSDRRAALGATRRPSLPVVRPMARGGALPVARLGAHGGFVAQGARVRPPLVARRSANGGPRGPHSRRLSRRPWGGGRAPRVGPSRLRRGPAPPPPPVTSLPAIYGPALC